MQVLIDVFTWTLTAIMLGVAATWVWLIISMLESFRKTPKLEDYVKGRTQRPKVSVILPARNEEKYIGKCLESLVNQDYLNYEIIAIDDSSEDNTSKIIEKFSKRNPKVIHVLASPKPEGWMGKNWACMEGYKKAKGSLLLFTDADTVHSSSVISMTVEHLISEKLDALTAIPKMLCLDFWTKITLPMISTFLHTRFSALRVNDPTKKTGYFFGSFFVIKKETYEEIGTHEGVKQEIIEDGALGKKVKEAGKKMKMVKADHLIEAVWARDLFTLWHALKRLMIPLYLQDSKTAWAIFFAVLFLLFMPFVILGSSAFITNSFSTLTLSVVSFIASILIYVGGTIETKELKIPLIYSILAPIGSLVVVLGFFAGLIHAKKDSAISWRGRKYSMKDHAQSSIQI